MEGKNSIIKLSVVSLQILSRIFVKINVTFL